MIRSTFRTGVQGLYNTEAMVNLATPPTSSHNRLPASGAGEGTALGSYFAALVETSQALDRGLDFYDVLEIILTKMMEVGRMGYSMMVLANEANEFQYISGYGGDHKPLNEGDLVIPPTIIDLLVNSREIVSALDI